MKKNKISLIIMMMVAFAFILSSCTATVTDNVEKDNNEVVEDKEMAYDFELLDLEGNTHKLSDYSGKKVYLKFWGTWCPVCVSGLNELSALHEQYLDSDTVILTVVAPSFSGEMSEEKFKQWYASQGYEFTVLLDPTADTFIEYGVRAFPSSAYIATDGSLHAFKIGHQQNLLVIEELAVMK